MKHNEATREVPKEGESPKSIPRHPEELTAVKQTLLANTCVCPPLVDVILEFLFVCLLDHKHGNTLGLNGFASFADGVITIPDRSSYVQILRTVESTHPFADFMVVMSFQLLRLQSTLPFYGPIVSQYNTASMWELRCNASRLEWAFTMKQGLHSSLNVIGIDVDFKTRTWYSARAWYDCTTRVSELQLWREGEDQKWKAVSNFYGEPVAYENKHIEIGRNPMWTERNHFQGLVRDLWIIN